ncbi:lamin tail domain-containing protein, partial [Microvirga zambiensis]|uniref:lamin tail domain-containing protein n=1 Tax=Microvirga zambiensis TaxID=1402137 RepID=UPI00191E6B80
NPQLLWASVIPLCRIVQVHPSRISKFQTQAWHSDDVSGDVIVPPDPDHPDLPHIPVDPNRIPPLDVPDGLVRIIAAYVNDVRTPERETVTLLNTADVAVDLAGWQIADKQKNRFSLSGSIEAGSTRVIVMENPVKLSNKGGIISLLDARGVKVHGVSYTKEQARQPGRTIPFQS